MPYVSPKDAARIRADAAAAALASTLERTGLHDEPVSSGSGSGANDQAGDGQTGSTSANEGEAEAEGQVATEATEDATEPSETADPSSSQHHEPPLTAPIPSHPSPLEQPPSPTPSHTPDAPSLISCATDSSNSLRTLSSASNPSDGEMLSTDAELDVVINAHDAELPKEASSAHPTHIELDTAAQLLAQTFTQSPDLAHTESADAEVELDIASPELAKYHRGIYAFTMQLYERAKRTAVRRKARAERAAATTGALAAVKV